MRSFLARSRPRKAGILSADPEIHTDEVRGRGCAAGGERSGRCCVRAVHPVAVLGCDSGEGRRVGAERGDLEGRGGCGLELLLEREVASGILCRSGLRIAQCDEGVLPHTPVGVGERDSTIADGVGLGCDARSFFPGRRAASDHGDEPSRERHGQTGGRTGAGRESVGGEPVEKISKAEVGVVVSGQRASLRPAAHAVAAPDPWHSFELVVSALAEDERRAGHEVLHG